METFFAAMTRLVSLHLLRVRPARNRSQLARSPLEIARANADKAFRIDTVLGAESQADFEGIAPQVFRSFTLMKLTRERLNHEISISHR